MRTIKFQERIQTSRHKWSEMPTADGSSIRDLVAQSPYSKGRRFFAVVRRRASSGPGLKETRRILLFDNHPATLALLFDNKATDEVAVPVGTSRRILEALVGLLLLCVLAAAMVWPLLAH